MGLFESMRKVDSRGSVIVFIAIAILPLVLLIALAIDSTRLSTSHTQKQRLANSMALAALEMYQTKLRETNPSLTYRQLVSAAVGRAVEVGRLQSNQLLLAKQAETFTANDIEELRTGQGTGTAGSIQLGKWWFEQPVEGCAVWQPPPNQNFDNTCPCGVSSGVRTWSGPCFEENFDLSATGVERVSAVRFVLRTPVASRLETIMSTLAGAEKGNLTVSATASLVPRNGVILIDMSRSTQFLTHLPIEQQASTQWNLASESAYMIGIPPGAPFGGWPAVSGWPASSASGSTNLCQSADVGPSGSMQCPVVPPGAWTWSAYRNGTAAKGLRSAGASSPITTHYANDYQYFTIGYSNETGASAELKTLVDVHYDASVPYRGPEPLVSILSGVNQAVQEVEARAVAGDRLGLIAFDQQANMNIRTFPPQRPGENVFQDLKQLADTSQSSNPILRAQKMFFPRGNANTDIPESLLEASKMLSTLPNFNIAENYVALFSDGLSNCRHCANCPPTNYQPMLTSAGELNVDECDMPAWMQQQDALRSWPLPKTYEEYTALTADKQAFTQNYRSVKATVHVQSALEARALLSGARKFSTSVPDLQVLPDGFPTFVDLNIAFHMFLFGSNVGPNTLIAPNPMGSGCLSDDDARKQNLPYVGSEFSDEWDELTSPPSWSDIPYPQYCTPSTPSATIRPRCGIGGPSNFNDLGRYGLPFRYLMPNKWFYEDGAKATGGLWVPIRPPCGASCSGLKTALDNACNSLKSNPWQDPTSLSGLSSLAGSVAPQFSFNAGGQIVPNWLLFCDAQCRTIEQQVRDGIRKIYEQNPYIIVD